MASSSSQSLAFSSSADNAFPAVVSSAAGSSSADETAQAIFLAAGMSPAVAEIPGIEAEVISECWDDDITNEIRAMFPQGPP